MSKRAGIRAMANSSSVVLAMHGLAPRRLPTTALPLAVPVVTVAK